MSHRASDLILSLITIHLVLHAAVLYVITDGPFNNVGASERPIPYALLVVGPSQGALLATWIALGGRHLAWRVFVAVAGTVAYCWCFSRVDRCWLLCAIGVFGICGILLLIARLAGLQVVRAEEVADAPRPLRFSIGDILIWTTAVAIVLSLLRFMRDDGTDFRISPLEAAFLAGFVLVAAGSIIASLGCRWLVARLLAAPIAIGLSTAWLRMSVPRSSSWGCILVFGLMAAYTVGSLLVVRWAGYRLAWQDTLRAGHEP